MAMSKANVIPVANLLSLVSSGVKLRSIIKERMSEVMLIKPQLIVSPTPSALVCSTANSKDTKTRGHKKNPTAALATQSHVLLPRVST